MAEAPRQVTLLVMPDVLTNEQGCWLCGTPPHAWNFDCPECARKWDEIECQELRERLFGPADESHAITS
jgi:hypothetical protein